MINIHIGQLSNFFTFNCSDINIILWCFDFHNMCAFLWNLQRPFWELMWRHGNFANSTGSSPLLFCKHWFEALKSVYFWIKPWPINRIFLHLNYLNEYLKFAWGSLILRIFYNYLYTYFYINFKKIVPVY